MSWIRWQAVSCEEGQVEVWLDGVGMIRIEIVGLILSMMWYNWTHPFNGSSAPEYCRMTSLTGTPESNSDYEICKQGQFDLDLLPFAS